MQKIPLFLFLILATNLQAAADPQKNDKKKRVALDTLYRSAVRVTAESKKNLDAILEDSPSLDKTNTPNLYLKFRKASEEERIAMQHLVEHDLKTGVALGKSGQPKKKP